MSKISIIMLVYNHERFLEKALESVLLQETKNDYELIIGEDASKDTSSEIIKKYEKLFKNKIKPIYRKKNVGMLKNLLDCLNYVTGDYIAFLEGDDYWSDSYKLQRQVEFLDNNLDYIGVAHNFEIRGVKDELLTISNEIDRDREYTINHYNKGEMFAQTSTWMIRNIISDVRKKHIGLIIRNIWIPMDALITCIFMSYGKLMILKENMSVYHYYIEENGDNWSSKYEREAKGNFLYFYLINIGKEHVAKKLNLNADLMHTKVEIFWQSRGQRHKTSGHSFYFLMQGFLMFLIEPHKIKMIKRIKETYNSDFEIV